MPSDGTDYQSLPNAVVALLPTPAVNDMGAAYTPDEWDAWTAKMKSKHDNGNGHGKSLNVEAQRLSAKGSQALVHDGIGSVLPSVDIDEVAEVRDGFGAESDSHEGTLARDFRADLEEVSERLLPTPTRRDHKDTEVRREPHRPDAVDTLARALTDVPAALLPTPSVADSTGGHEHRGGERGEELLLKGLVRAVAEGALLPTPVSGDGDRSSDHYARGNPTLLGALLPTPTAQDAAQSGGGYNGQTNVTLTDATVRQPDRWGEYGPAIRRWEAITRPAPEPTKLNAKGNPKLSDEFDEWLMGYPAGWITDVPGVTWNETLKACGNGVVWQQGAAAVRWLIQMGRAAA